VASSVDLIIVPRESQWFGFFKPNSTTEILPLHQSPLYTDDWIGLRALDKAGKLHFASCACHHRDVPSDRCRVQIWDRLTRSYLQPEGSLPALGRWLSPEWPSQSGRAADTHPEPRSPMAAQDAAVRALARAAKARAAAAEARTRAGMADAHARKLAEEARRHMRAVERAAARHAAEAGVAAAMAATDTEGGGVGSWRHRLWEKRPQAHRAS